MKISALAGGLSAIVLLFIFKHSVDLGICSLSDYDCRSTFSNLALALYIAPIFTFFAIVTFFWKEPFRLWWPFAVTTAPIIFIISIILLSGFHHTGGGFINIDQDIDAYFIFLLYALFALGSIIQIIRGALRGRDNAKSK